MLTRNAAEVVLLDEFCDPSYEVDDVRAELSAGLLRHPAQTSPKYLYDGLGSKLFEAICELPEYYLTRTEAAIFEVHLHDIARSVGRGCTLIDLGAGNCAKAARLFPALRPAQYVAIDISAEFLRDELNDEALFAAASPAVTAAASASIAGGAA